MLCENLYCFQIYRLAGRRASQPPMNGDEINACCFDCFDELDGLAEVFVDSDFY
jgi:hypothetical protein